MKRKFRLSYPEGVASGFTIVELLIVVVVIAILAAITAVSYAGITNRANDASVQSGISSVAKKLLFNGTTDPTVFCNDGSSDALLAPCLNASTTLLALPETALGSGTSVVRYYNQQASNPSPVVAGLSKSGKAFIFEDGKVREITPAQFSNVRPGCGGYATWSSITDTWSIAYTSC